MMLERFKKNIKGGGGQDHSLTPCGVSQLSASEIIDSDKNGLLTKYAHNIRINNITSARS